jgi:hypothetical protein
LKKWHFLAKKVKNFFKNAIFFLKFCEGGEGILLAPHPPPIPPSKLMYASFHRNVLTGVVKSETETTMP